MLRCLPYLFSSFFVVVSSSIKASTDFSPRAREPTIYCFSVVFFVDSAERALARPAKTV